MLDIAIRRLRVLPFVPASGEAVLYREQAMTLLAELAALGYRLTNPSLLAGAGAASLAQHTENMRTLSAMRGADHAWVPLFSGFPESVPDEHEYFARRVVGVLGNALRMFDAGETLENGLVVPEWLFDLRAFGADPITQMQTRALFEQGRAQQADRAVDTHTEWIDLELVSADEAKARVEGWLKLALAARSPLSEGVRADVARLLRVLGPGVVQPEQITLKETLAFVLHTYWQADAAEALASVVRSPTDLLRLFALATETDVSLATPIKFPRFSRRARRMALSALEGCPRLLEDLGRYRRLWLAIGKGLHVGEHARRFPRTAAAFVTLRAGPVRSFAAQTDAFLRVGDVNGVLAHLSQRPGVFVRQLHALLRRLPAHTEAILLNFSAVAHRVPVRTLLVLDAYFQTINSRTERAIVNKRGRIKILDNTTRGALSEAQLDAVRSAIEEALLTVLADREPWSGQTASIAPELAGVTVPLQQRAASDGLIPLGRGSRIPIDGDKVLRLFVYWKQAAKRTDLDLSVIQFGEDYDYLGHVSYTRLKGDGIVHSGDIQSAPEGASEFIDITLSALPDNVRYLAPQIYRYSGESFADLAESFAGWMVREDTNSTAKAFDPKTVANGYALQGTGGYALPLLVDLKRGEIVLIDLCVGGAPRFNRVEGATDDIIAIISELADFTRTRPTMGRLASLHVRARGAEPVAGDAEADICFGVNEGTYAANQPAQILAELL